MDLVSIAAIASATGTLLAAAALTLNVLQSRHLEQSIRGNTYQQLSLYALEMYKVLLEDPEIDYLPSQVFTSGASREQVLFDRLLGNYLENVWLQRRYGLVDAELAEAYDGLLSQVLSDHASVRHLMTGENYVGSLRSHISELGLAPNEGGAKSDTDSQGLKAGNDDSPE